MGRDLRVLKLTFFIFIHMGFSPWVISSDELCHPSCFCLDTFFDCRKQGLSKFPSDFPVWVKKLNLSSNAISTLDRSSIARLRQLEAISLDANNFSSIPDLGELPVLKQLTLSKNSIVNVTSYPLMQLNALEELDLSRNRIEALSNDSFPPNWPLKILNLGFNHLEVILSGWLNGVSQLIDLNLAKNKLRTLPKDSFVHLKELEKLDLSRNKLEMIDSLRFQELKKLQVLSLRRNHMSNLSDAAFYGLETMQHLYLDGNNIKLVEKRWLYGLRSLKTLNLSKNDIGRIDDDSWEYLEELQILDLNTNYLESISKRGMAGLGKLRLLDLSFNRINEIEEDSFLSMEHLEILDLSHNDLSWVVEDVPSPFKGLAECHTLNLAANKIRSLHPLALDGLESLMNLNLTANPIKWLSEKTFQEFPHINLALANIDTFICDCQSAWLRSRNNVAPTSKGRNRHRDTDWRVARKANKEREVDREKQLGSLSCSFPPSLNGRNLFDISIENLTCLADNSLRPEFLEEPRTEIFLMEGNGSLSCVARSHANAPVTLTWKKDHKDLPKQLESNVSNLQRMEDTGGTTIQSTLQLINVSWNFAGAYQCVAENSYGVTYTTMANVTVHVFPTFIKKPANVTVRLSSNAKLECAAKGHPTPEIAFQKDGGEDFPAALDRRFHVMPNDDSFFIMEVKVSDMGVYCCSAKNSAGEIKSCATVTVYDTPSFSEPMEDENAVEGNNAILACLASGSPKPLISWNKDGVGIIVGKDKRFHLTENGTLLLIKDVQMQDSGRYECLLSNAVGTTRGFSTLTVLPNTAGKLLHLDTSAMTIIFIIIAVFCVVGTSAAWVVVIYRTRKRNNNISEPRHVKYDDEESRPGFSGSLSAFGTNCKLIPPGCPDSDSQSSSGKDSGTGEDIPPESDPLEVVDVEHESLMRPGRRKTELESFSTFGAMRPNAARISQVRLDLQNDLATDVISLAHAPGREFYPTKRTMTKVSVPVPPDKDMNAERRSTCPSNSSSSGYSSSGVKIYSNKSVNRSRADSVNSEELENLQHDRSSVDQVTSISTPV